MDSDSFSASREHMVSAQIESRGLRSPRLLAAMRRVPRHQFVPAECQKNAYDDGPLPIGLGQTISQPYIVALMTSLLELEGTENVLEIGTGSGYQAAILAELAAEVYSIDRMGDLAKRAKSVLDSLGYANVQIRVGDGTLGWPEAAPFDGIIVTAGAPKVPRPLTEQLALGGRLVIPVGDMFSQTLTCVRKTESGLKFEYHGGCRFVRLIGKFGWPEGQEGGIFSE